jgi:predicted metal-binding membrane protein
VPRANTSSSLSLLKNNSTMLPVAALLATAGVAWLFVIRDSVAMQHAMSMQSMTSMNMSARGNAVASSNTDIIDGLAYCARWGVMMTAMMLPSAMPMILLYRTVRTRLAEQGERSIPVWAFVSVYLLMWLLFGVPVYLGQSAVTRLSSDSRALAAAVPYAIAGLLLLAGAYQFSALKRACLRSCESPLSFLMRRWRPGYKATTLLALEHAAFCIGCCWALMVILVAAGAMSLPWVLAIAAIVATEKLLPSAWRSREIAGLLLLLLGVAVALRPELAGLLRGTT